MDKFINNLDVVLFYYLLFLVPVIIGCIIEKISERKELKKNENSGQVVRNFRGKQLGAEWNANEGYSEGKRYSA